MTGQPPVQPPRGVRPEIIQQAIEAIQRQENLSPAAKARGIRSLKQAYARTNRTLS